LQALINMAVNVGLLPAKGMTLPFISYGGSSLLAMALTMGLALGLTRRRPKAGRLPRSRTSQAGEASEASEAGTTGEAAAGTRADKNASEQTA
jgi:cell division protein FtsW